MTASNIAAENCHRHPDKGSFCPHITQTIQTSYGNKSNDLLLPNIPGGHTTQYGKWIPEMLSIIPKIQDNRSHALSELPKRKGTFLKCTVLFCTKYNFRTVCNQTPVMNTLLHMISKVTKAWKRLAEILPSVKGCNQYLK